ncbi:MAG: hypothetical protein AAB477_01545, partial [Patescibacteria group bacterium]
MDNNQKFLSFLKRIWKKSAPRFSIHYVIYTALFMGVVFSVVSIVTATTPNPGHPWVELGDGVFTFTNGQTVTNYTYTFPATNSIVITNSIGLSGGSTLIGGTATTDDLTLQSTSGAGTTGSDIIFKDNDTEFIRILNSGFVGIGDASPAALFTVGASDAFQVTNTGVITSSNLASAGDRCLHASSAGVISITGSDCGTGTITWDAIASPVGNQSLTFDATEITTWTATSYTTQKNLNIVLGTSLTTGGAIAITGASYLHGAETGSLVSLAFTDATTAAVTSTTNGILLSPTINAASGAATRTINGISVEPAFTACAAGTCAVNGVNIGNVTDGTGFTSTGLKVGTGWDYGAIIEGGNVGIGDTTPSAKLEILGESPATYIDAPQALIVTGGVGAAGTGPINAGRVGGGVTLLSGNGGTSDSNTGGAAGTIVITGGTGGNGAGGGGRGGIITINPGAGGTGGAGSLPDGYVLLAPTVGVVGVGRPTNAFYKLDVLSAATGQTVDYRTANFSNTGATFDTTSGVLSSYGGYFSSTSTRSAGSNDLTNIGLYSTASGAQNNIAAQFEGTVTNTGQVQDINLTLGNDGDADTVSALNIDVTSATTGDADILYGVDIANLTSGSAVTETALHIGTGWDTLISGTTAGTNIFSFTNSSLNTSGALVVVGVNSGTGLIQGTGGLTVTGATNINATGTAATNIGNSTGALTIASGGTSGWTNTAGNLTVQTVASGTLALSSAGNLTTATSSSGAATHSVGSSTTAAFRIQDVSSNAYYTVDTRTVSSISAHTFVTGVAPTIASAATAYYNSSTFTPGIVNFSGNTQITSTGTIANNALLFNQPTINRTAAASNLTIDQASNLFINGATIATHATGGQTETITASSALRIGAGSALNGTNGVVTNGYGLYVDAPTGATNNYAAVFNGGRVGIGTAAPTGILDVSDGTRSYFKTVGTETGGIAILMRNDPIYFTITADGSGRPNFNQAVVVPGIINPSHTNTAFSFSGNDTFNFSSLGIGANNFLFSTQGTVASGTILSVKNNTVEEFTILANGNVGIGAAAPGASLDVDRPDASSITTEQIQLRSSATAQTLTDGTTITNWRNNQYIAPTLNGVAAGGTETVTNAATLYIDAAPTGSNIAITNPYSLWADAGNVRFDDELQIGSATDLGAYALQVTGNAYVTSQIDFGSTGAGQGSLFKSGTEAVFSSAGLIQVSGTSIRLNASSAGARVSGDSILFLNGGNNTFAGIGGGNTGALIFYYEDASDSPNEAARFSNAGLFSTVNNTITDTNSLFDLNLTLGNDATADTVSALNIDVTSVATGADGDILYGINVANLTSADADVAESAIRVGTGWDNIFTSANASLTQAGALTVTSCTGCGGAGGTLQQTYDADADTGDTTITLSTADDSLIISNPTASGTDSAFAFKINQQHTTGAVSALDIIQASNGANAINVTANAVDTETGLAISSTALTTGKAQTIALGTALTTGGAIAVTGASYLHGAETGSLVSLAFTDATTAAVTSTTNGILLSPTINAASGAATRTINGISVEPAFTACAAGTCAVRGINIANVTDGTGFTGTALNIGTGWDTSLNIASGNFTITANTAVDSYIDLTSTGDFVIKDSSVGIAAFTDAGAITFAPTSGQNFSIQFPTGSTGRIDVGPTAYNNGFGGIDIVRTVNQTGVAGQTAIELGIQPNLTLTEPGSGTFTWNGIDADMASIVVTAAAGSSVYNSIRVAGVSDGDATTVRGLFIDNLTATAAAETAIEIGTGWDNAWVATGGFAHTLTGQNFSIANNGAGDVTFRDDGNVVFNLAGDGHLSYVPGGGANAGDLTYTLDDDSNVIVNGTVTNTGNLFDFNLTLGNDVASADTVSALNVDVTSVATGADGDILYGINVANLTSADADVAETGIRVGTSWDTVLGGTTAGTSIFDFTNFDVLTGGGTDIGGTITAGSGNEIITLSTGKIDADAITLAPLTGTATTNSSSGLEVVSDGLSLLKGCADGQILEYTNDATGWTCGNDDTGGGGGTLQGAYDGDTVGGDVTISLTSADDSLIFLNPTSAGTDSAFLAQFDQANTTAAVLGLDIIQRSNNANGVNLTANAIDTETALAITANALTSGKGLSIASSSTAFTGNIASFTLSGSNASNTGSVVLIDNTGTASTNTGLKINHYATGTGNLALRIDDESGDTTPFIIDGDGRVGIGTAGLSVNSATERLLQVGSETNRGNSVTYGEVATKGLKDITALTDIKDVFLYDTTADSDGGRWIDWATTDRLSWYSETLDDGPSDPCNIASDDRCYTSHFPRKALLIVTGSALYIFDSTNNVMWMKFTQDASGFALGADTNNNPSSVTALNGVVYVGAKGTASGGLYAFDFVNDRMWNYDATDRAAADVGISGRNAAVVYASDAKTTLQLDPVGTSAEWMNINDVAAVSVNSSLSAITIGAATNVAPGQGQSFVALATDSGVTIINLAAQKLLQYSDVTADNYEAVSLTRSGKMYALNSTSDQVEKWDAVDSDKNSEVNGAYTSRWTAAVGPAIASATVAIQTDAPDALEVVERGSLAENNMDLIYAGHNLGLVEIHDATTNTNGWSKFYNTTRQTMLMPNAIDAALPLDDPSGTLAQDASFNNTDMSYKGTFTLGVPGVRGKAVGLGNAGYLCSDANADGTCDNDASFNSTTTAFNISMWFKHSTTAPATPDVLFEKCYNTTPAVTVGCVVAYMTTTGTVVGAIDATTTFTQFTTYDVTATSSLTYNDDQWHFLLMSRDNANDMNVYIDGVPLNLSTATGQTATVDAASQVTSIGASCSAAANCGTGTNFWDGSIDDFTFSSGATTVSNLLSAPARRLYNDSRPLVGKRTINVTDATTASSTTLGDSGETWIPNEFSGLIVEITGGTGVAQSRRVISNTTTTLTVSPAFTTTPDTTSDFEIDPESLYGASDIVNAVGITAESPLGEARMMCAGTNSTSDTGGVTCYNHQAGPNVVAEVFHADALKLDDANVEWTGTDYDDIKSIDLAGRSLYIGSMAHFYSRTEDVRLGQGLDYLANQLFNIRGEIIQDGILLTGSLGLEIGFTGGADLAEYYYSNTPLEAGDVVAIQPDQPAGIGKSSSRYQKNLLGVVSTQPGLILGPKSENAYPIALTGRIPVKITNENGPIRVGDLLTSSSRPGYAMRATAAGAIIGRVLNEPEEMTSCDAALPDLATAVGDGPGVTGAPDEEGATPEVVVEETPAPTVSGTGPKCGYAMLFAGLGESLGKNVEILATEFGSLQGGETTIGGVTTTIGTQSSIMAFLRASKADLLTRAIMPESIFTDRIAAGLEILTPTLIADNVKTNTISAVDGNVIGMILGTDGKFTIGGQTANTIANPDGTTTTTTTASAPVITFDSLGNATFAGTVSAKEIKIGDMVGIQAITDQINNLAEGQQAFTLTAQVLTSLSDALALAQADIVKSKEDLTAVNTAIDGLTTSGTDIDNRVKIIESFLTKDANGTVTGFAMNALSVSGDSSFLGQAKFDGLSFFSNITTFSSGVSFAGQTEFALPPLYNKDSAGYALIKQGDRRAKILFTQPYIATPVVNTSITFETDDNVDDVAASALFTDDIRFIIVGKDQTGFTILLNKNATRDIRFSWNAFSVKDPSIFESIFKGLTIDPTPTPEETPEPTPTPETPPTCVEPQILDTTTNTCADPTPTPETPPTCVEPQILD